MEAAARIVSKPMNRQDYHLNKSEKGAVRNEL